MISIKEKQECCGCNACVQRCPKGCITMQEDNEGFFYPRVVSIVCNNCGLCETVCPVINQSNTQKPLKFYAAKNKNEKILLESSSGGIFTILAENVIAMGGVIFGAKFNEKWEVVHDYTETIDGLQGFRGSKYVQSQIGETYRQAEEFLKQGREVLFSGTPCQIAGLKLFLKKEYDNLLSVDVVCHGVPSPKVFKKYLAEIIQSEIAQKIPATKTVEINIQDIQFRDKRLGWKKYSFSLTFSVNTRSEKSTFNFSESLSENVFLKGFLSNLYLRPSCHACAMKKFNAGSDITIADFWAVDKFHSGIVAHDKGASLLIIMNQKGNNYWKQIDKKLTYIESKNEIALIVNPAINKSAVPHKKRKKFFENYNYCNSLSDYISQLIMVPYTIKIFGLVQKIIIKMKYIYCKI